MAYYRTTIFGRQIGGDIWNMTAHGQMVTGQAAIINNQWLDAVTLAWTGIAAPTDSVTQLFDTATHVDGVRTDELDSLGHNVSQSVGSLALSGTGTGEALPPQVSMVLSLRTVLPTRGGRGRMYWPAPTVDQMNSQRMLSACRSSLLAASGAMLEHANGLEGYNVVVYHRGNKTGTAVIRCDVGDVFDTQRRRRNALIEQRIIHTLL